MRRTLVVRSMFYRAVIAVTLGLTVMGTDKATANPDKPGEVDFARDIKPIFERSCVQCHSGQKPKGGLRMDSRADLLKGGESKEAAIIPGEAANSPLVRFVSDLVHEMEMPPLDKREKYAALTRSEIALVRRWIDLGAAWPGGVTLAAGAVSPAERDCFAVAGCFNFKTADETLFTELDHLTGQSIAGLRTAGFITLV